MTHVLHLSYEVSARAKEIVSTISDPSLLEDPSTPQAKALEWIMLDDLETHPDPASQKLNPMIQRQILALFYYSTEGDNWLNNFSWLTSTSECEWYGCGCDHDGRVVSLTLDDNGLAGSIPEELFGLADLEKLDLSSNDLTGTISSGIGQLTSLTHLELGGNDFTGTIPEEIGSLSGLQHVDLSCNTIIGMIPDQIGDLVSLTLFKLHENRLTGIIPESVCENRNNSETPGLLETLTSDCGGPFPEVVCGCCSDCQAGTPRSKGGKGNKGGKGGKKTKSKAKSKKRSKKNRSDGGEAKTGNLFN